MLLTSLVVNFLVFLTGTKATETEVKCWGNSVNYPFQATVVDEWESGATIFMKISHETAISTEIRVNIFLSRPMPNEALFMSWSSKLIESDNEKIAVSVPKKTFFDTEENEISLSFILNDFKNLRAETLIESTTIQIPCNEVIVEESESSVVAREPKEESGKSPAVLADESNTLASAVDPELLPLFENPAEHDEFAGDDNCPYIPSIPGVTGLYTKQNIWSEGDGGHVFEAFMNLEFPSLNTWTIKLVFSDPVDEIRIWNAIASKEEIQDGYVWYLTPLDYNFNTELLQFNMHIKLTSDEIPMVWLFLCNNGVKPSQEMVIPPWDFKTVLDEAQSGVETDFPNDFDNNIPGNLYSVEDVEHDAIYQTDLHEQENIEIDDAGIYVYVPETVVLLNTVEMPPPSNPFCTVYNSQELKLSNKNTVPNCKTSLNNDSLKYDYNTLLCMSILFYEAQRSGVISPNSRIPWRGNASLQDGCFSTDGTEPNLSGGWYDSSDNKKFGFPMASAVTVLAWGMIEFRDSYEDAEEWQNAKDMIKWAADYFVNAHTAENELWAQITPFNGDIEELTKTRPEDDTWLNMAYKIDEDNPGSDLAGETAAALAATSLVFREEDPDYANILLWHAHTLYKFADNHRGFYHDAIPEAGDYYYSFGDYTDEIVWGCIWVSRALKDTNLLTECRNKYDEFNLQQQNPFEFSWALKTPGINVLLAQFTGEAMYIEQVEAFFDHTLRFDRTPGGLSFVSKYGANRYAANLATIALMAGNNIEILANKDKYLEYAQEQIYAMLGDGDAGRSYVVGFGSNSPSRYVHLASACPISNDNSTDILPCSMTNLYDIHDNPNILYGALVGGPSNNRGNYVDGPDNKDGNSVALDYNAGFQTAVAGLKHFAMKKRT